MKHIVSTTGKKISFLLNAKRNLTIDPIVPIEVNELEYEVLLSRLGAQIHVSSPEVSADGAVEEETVLPAPTAPAAPEQEQTIPETPVTTEPSNDETVPA